MDGFIADCRKRVPLESVRTDLREYSSSLENELVELINKDYTDFVNLSSNLAGIDEVLNELREPLCKIKDEAQVYILVSPPPNKTHQHYRHSTREYKQ